MVKYGGQLNALIFEDNTVKMDRCDFLQERKVIHDVKYHTQIPFFITFNHGNIQILEQHSIQSKVYCPYNNRTFWVENEFVTKDMKAYDYTNYEIPLKKRRYRQRGIRLSR